MSDTTTIQKISSLIDNIRDQHPEIGEVLSFLSDQLDEKKGEITGLVNRVSELECRVLDLERYNSKDSLIISNFPWNGQPNLTVQIVDFFRRIFKTDFGPESIKACHFLGKPNIMQPPAIIVKFIYFDDKNFIWRSKGLLKGVKNHQNGKAIYLNERLPEKDREVQKYANKDCNLQTVTNNCAVKLQVKTESGSKQFVEVRSKKEVDRLAADAVKKNDPSSSRLPPKKTPKRPRETDTARAKLVADLKNCTTNDEKLQILEAIITSPAAKLFELDDESTFTTEQPPPLIPAPH